MVKKLTFEWFFVWAQSATKTTGIIVSLVPWMQSPKRQSTMSLQENL